MSFIEDDESKWSAADHAEQALRPLMKRVKDLHATARKFDDAESLNATGRCFTDFLASVLWQRRNLPEHGGCMRSPPDQAAIAERDGILAEVLELLAGPALTPAIFAHAASILGTVKFAEYDGTMQSQADFDTLLDIYRAWIELKRVTAEGSGPGILHYLSNTAISVTNLDDEAMVEKAATIIQAMAQEVSVAPDQITEHTANNLADLCGALLHYQGQNPQRAYPQLSSWQFLMSVSWRQPMLEKVNWPKLAELACWAVTMLRKQESAESATVWSWLAEKLAERPLPLAEDVNWRNVGFAFVEALLDENVEDSKAEALLSALQSLVEAGGPSAVEAFGGGLTNVIFSIPRARGLNPHNDRFLLRALESGISSPEESQVRIRALVCLLSHYAFHNNRDLVDESLARFADPNSASGWAGLVVAYRTISELALMPDAGSRIGAIIQYVSTPYAGTEGAAAVEAARRAAVDSLLSRPELEVHPRIFFPLLGISSDG